jgi:RNA polymerase sigma-70 factor (ECF subfamily)
VSEQSVGRDLTFRDQELSGLLSKTAQGDEAALGALYNFTSAQVYGLALRVLDDPTMAEEVTLDVYMQVWKRAHQFDVNRGKPIVWLAVLTRSRAIDRLRTGQTERLHRETLAVVEEESDPSGNPEETVVRIEQRRLVQQALASLNSEQREVIELAYFSGLSQSEIASRIGEPLGTVKTRVRLGMIKLRNILGTVQEELAS